MSLMDGQKDSETTQDSISNQTDQDEDKKFASQAVAFVIKHSCNGFVSLCASVATLLQEQAKLKQQVKSFQSAPDKFKLKPFHESVKENLSAVSNNAYSIGNSSSKNPSTSSLSAKKEAILLFDSSVILDTDKLRTKNRKQKICKSQKHNKIIQGCLCDKCCNASGSTVTVPAPLQMGQTVIIRGEICGRVLYVGHVESDKSSEVYVGLQLDESVGNSNGEFGKKIYFTCPRNCGLFIPLSHILCVVK